MPNSERHELLEGELLESAFVEMDPVVDGFAGVLVELMWVGQRYVLREAAVGSGNRLAEIDVEVNVSGLCRGSPDMYT
jgi:hypothetical protein